MDLKINIPTAQLSIKTIENQKKIFDVFRRKWVAFTPEEYVRQSLAHFLVNYKSYPKELIAVEYSFSLSTGKKFRADIVVFDKEFRPVLLVECKSPSVKISESVLKQLTIYNSHIKSKNVMVTNGINHYFLTSEDAINYAYSSEIKDYNSL